MASVLKNGGGAVHMNSGRLSTVPSYSAGLPPAGGCGGPLRGEKGTLKISARNYKKVLDKPLKVCYTIVVKKDIEKNK